jgi:LAO/AO transport system kinase
MTKDIDYYVAGVAEGNRLVLSRTITLIESGLQEHQKLGRQVVDQLLDRTGKAVRLGITGVPGAGKSTFIESLGLFLADQGKRVAVLAVDPSSTRSGGSILADKTRMEKLSIHERAFIRPSPSGGTLGGVARKTRESMLVCEAAGYDVIIVETVGVGQSETTVASMVDFFLVLMIAGAGDQLQGIKKGVLEVADALAVNKADGDNVQRAEMARREYEAALHLLTPSTPTWSPPVLTCSALEMTGVDRVWETVLDHRGKMTASGELAKRRRDQALEWMMYLVKEGLEHWFYRSPDVRDRLPRLREAVAQGHTSPTVAADRLLEFLETRETGRESG